MLGGGDVNCSPVLGLLFFFFFSLLVYVQVLPRQESQQYYPNGIKANAAGLNGCAYVRRMRSGEKRGGKGQARQCKAFE